MTPERPLNYFKQIKLVLGFSVLLPQIVCDRLPDQVRVLKVYTSEEEIRAHPSASCEMANRGVIEFHSSFVVCTVFARVIDLRISLIISFFTCTNYCPNIIPLVLDLKIIIDIRNL